jgi:4-hydroxybenzoate polyprenyltransferase
MNGNTTPPTIPRGGRLVAGKHALTAPVPHTLRPLCVDLDGTLLATDVLWESLLLLLKTKPLWLLLIPVWLIKGKAFLKRQMAQCVRLNPASLPYRVEIISFLKEEKKLRKEIILVTASDQQVADIIADYLGIFSAVLGSDGKVNLSGEEKLKALKKYFGHGDFDYMGNSFVDIPLWQAAHQAILVYPSLHLVKQVSRESSVQKLFLPQTKRLASCLMTLRIYQWVKNILLFVPLVLAHEVMNMGLIVHALLAFIAFSLCASSVYIINDLLDLENDRMHPYKKHRPLASGAIQIKTSLIMIPALLLTSLSTSILFINFSFAVVIFLYFSITSAYSLYIKHILIADVLLLAGLYTFRVFSGGIATNISISPWLLAFSIFFFLSLAFMKRYSELYTMRKNRQKLVTGRAYTFGDMTLLRSIGPASGYLSVLVFTLYIESTTVKALYPHPTLLWLINPFLLYWITRLWFFAHRGEMNDDPLVFAIKDPMSYVLGITVAVLLVISSL